MFFKVACKFVKCKKNRYIKGRTLSSKLNCPCFDQGSEIVVAGVAYYREESKWIF